MTQEPLFELPLPAPGNYTEQDVIDLWLHNRPAATRTSYQADLKRFSESHGGKTLSEVTRRDVTIYFDSLAGLKPASRRRMLSSIRSLFKFALKVKFVTEDMTDTLLLPKLEDKLAERILSELDMQKIILAETRPRNKVLLTLLYATGIRAHELCQLEWPNLQHHLDGEGQITIYGKGGKTRSLLIPERLWQQLLSLKPVTDGPVTGPVFVSRQGRGSKQPAPLSETHIWRIVRAAARKAGIKENVSPHWFRHAAGSHALDRGAPIHLVQRDLGHASLATTGRYLHARPGDGISKHLPV